MSEQEASGMQKEACIPPRVVKLEGSSSPQHLKHPDPITHSTLRDAGSKKGSPLAIYTAEGGRKATSTQASVWQHTQRTCVSSAGILGRGKSEAP